MNTKVYERLLLTSWINLGIFNLQDGSQDGDINTLQLTRQREYQSTANGPQRHDTQTLREAITIEHQPTPSPTPTLPLVERPPTPKDVQYNLNAAERVSRVHEVPKSIYTIRMERECQRICAPMIAEWRESMSQDLSNLSNSRPQTDFICSPLDVECLKNVVTEIRGRREAIYLLTKIMGINWRNPETGRIQFPASRRPVIDWSSMTLPQLHEFPVTQLRDIILNDVRSRSLIEGPTHSPDRSGIRPWTTEDLLCEASQRAMERVAAMNPHLPAGLVRRDYRAMMGYTALMPSGRVTDDHLNCVNWSRERGGLRGECCTSYRRLARAFQQHCEQNGAWFRVKWDALDDQEGLCIYKYLQFFKNKCK